MNDSRDEVEEPEQMELPFDSQSELQYKDKIVCDLQNLIDEYLESVGTCRQLFKLIADLL